VGRIFSFLPDGVTESRLRFTPTTLQVGATYVDLDAETRRYEEIVALPQDSIVVPIRTIDERLTTNVGVTFEPVSALTGRAFFTQGRQLVPSNLLVTGDGAQDLIDAERTSLFGVDLGWETARDLDVNWTYRPTVAPWLTPQATLDTRFKLSTGASFISQEETDTTLTRDFGSSRSLRLSAGFNAPAFLRGIFGEQSSGAMGAFFGFMDRIDVFTITWFTTLGSSFQRREADPGLGYQLGFGGFDKFRVQQGDTASRVSDSETLTLSAGFRLPLGAGLNVDYSDYESLVWSPNTQVDNQRKTWPNIGLSWNRLPIPSFLHAWVANLAFRTGYTQRNTSYMVAATNQDRDSETRTIPFNFDLALTTQWSFNYNLTLTDEERRDPTGVTFGDQTNQTLVVTGQINSLSETGTFRNPIRISLRLSQNDQNRCRRLGAAFVDLPPEVNPDEVPSCEPFTKLRIRNIGLTIGTDVPPFVIGLQGLWRDTQSELGQRPGSTQLEIALFGQFLFETGEIR
jgi:hypothetical protein